MAMRDEIREQRRSLKGQGPKAYWKYFWEYYRIPTLVGIFAAVCLISIVKEMLTNKDSELTIEFLNAQYVGENLSNENVAKQLAADFTEWEGENKDPDAVYLDMSSTLTPGRNFSLTDNAVITANLAKIDAGIMDAMIADADLFQYYVEIGCIEDLSQVLDADTLKTFEDRDMVYYIDLTELEALQEKMQELDYSMPTENQEEAVRKETVGTFVRPDPTDMDQPAPVGIYMTDAAFMQETGIYGDVECIFGFMGRSENKDRAVKFLEFMADGFSEESSEQN